MTAAGQVRSEIVSRLKAAGLDAAEAYEDERFRERSGSVVAVGAKQAELAHAGLMNYLGEQYDAESGRTVEVYGRKLKMAASLDVYAPRRKGARGCEQTAEAVSEALLAALYRNGAAVVKAVKVSAATPTGYEAAFAALEQEAVDVIVCDSTSVDVQLKLRASVEKASGAQKERIGVVSGGASETAAKLVERAGKLNSERMVLTAPGDVRMAAAAAAVIAGESDPSVPVNGAVLAGFSGLSASYDDTQVDTLVTGGVTPLECVSGEVSIVRGITTRTTTGGAADKTWRELTTVRIVDDVIPALRASLRARFVRSKNTAQVRAAIRSQVMVELENKRAQEIIDSFGEVSVKASEDDPTVCLVEFSFAVAHGLNRIYLSAHITV